MASKPRILLVDDDPATLALTAEFLTADAEVVAVDRAVEALRVAVNTRIDMLLTDLDVQHSCDGLLIASTVRYCWPSACTVLVTGLPDFLRALRDVQRNLDLTLVKPLGMEQLRALVELARDPEARQQVARTAATASVWDLIARREAKIIETWYQQVIADPRLAGPSNERSERLDHLPELLHALTTRLEKSSTREHAVPAPRSPEEQDAARKHGRLRRAQGYLPHWVSLETSYLRRGIVNVILNELVDLDLAVLQSDLLELYERLDESLLDSLEAFGLRKP